MLCLNAFLSSVIGANNFTTSGLSVVKSFASFSFTNTYESVSFNPKSINLFLICLFVLS